MAVNGALVPLLVGVLLSGVAMVITRWWWKRRDLLPFTSTMFLSCLLAAYAGLRDHGPTFVRESLPWAAVVALLLNAVLVGVALRIGIAAWQVGNQTRLLLTLLVVGPALATVITAATLLRG